MNNLSLRIALFSLFLLGAVSAQAAELATAKVLKVSGTVTLYSPGQAQRPLAKGDILHQGDSITSAALSKADLVFSNGSLVTVEENSSLSLKELKQQAYGGGQSYEDLEADPSVSQTLLELNYGKVSGHTKELKEGSTFDIETPLGTAAIRGTFWIVEIFYNAEAGQMILKVTNLGGTVDIISRFVGSIQYGAGNIGDKGYDSSASETKRANIPDRHIVFIRLSKDDPNYDDIIDALENYPPMTDDKGRPPVIITLPTPEITPEDPGVIVVSPETEMMEPVEDQ